MTYGSTQSVVIRYPSHQKDQHTAIGESGTEGGTEGSIEGGIRWYRGWCRGWYVVPFYTRHIVKYKVHLRSKVAVSILFYFRSLQYSSLKVWPALGACSQTHMQALLSDSSFVGVSNPECVIVVFFHRIGF